MNNTKKFNSDNYFSDDDDDDINQDNHIDNIDGDEDYDEGEETDDSMDEESKQIIYRSMRKDRTDFTFFVEKEPDKDKPKQPSMDKSKKTKKSMSLNDFVQKIDAEEKAKQPKKFVSKRVVEKINKFGASKDIKPKRSFNPRMRPYNFVQNKKITNDTINFLSEHEFPSLK